MHPPDRLDCVCSALHSYRAAVRTRTIRKANLIVNAQAPVAAIIKSLHTMLVLQHVLTPKYGMVRWALERHTGCKRGPHLSALN